jgi:tetratricopeptide (TPR) repeat protein
VKKTVVMQNLLDQSQAPRLVEQFAHEDIARWPFWKRGDGYFARGRAYAATKSGKEAEADLARALAWTSDPRVRDAIRLALGQNREDNLKDSDAALTAYQAILAEGSGDPRLRKVAGEKVKAMEGR